MNTRTIGLLAVLATSLVGCGGLAIRGEWVIDPPEKASEAIELVAAIYGPRFPGGPFGTVSHPEVIWYGEQAVAGSPECANWTYDPFRPDHPSRSYRSTAGNCVSGEELDDVAIELAPAPGKVISDTTLAHEFAHWRWNVDGHPDSIFGLGGPVEQANAALIAAGM